MQPEEQRACVACDRAISVKAWLCPECGTRQSRLGRYFVRAATLAGVLTTILSLATAGVALYPSAVKVLFPSSSAKLYSVLRTRSGPQDIDVLKIGLINDGNTDLYISQLEFIATDPTLSSVNKTVFRIRESIPAGAILDKEIELRPLVASRLTTVSISGFQDHKAELEKVGRYRPGCYFIEPNGFDEANPPPLPQFAIAEAVTEIEAHIVYSTSNTRGQAKTMMVTDDMTGTVLFRSICAEKDPPKDRLR